MVCGLWSVVCGLWSVVCGLWSVKNVEIFCIESKFGTLLQNGYRFDFNSS